MKSIDLIIPSRNTESAVRDLPITETDTEIRIDLATDVLFDFDKADLKPEAQASLKQPATVIRRKATGPVVVAGRTDNKGAAAYNQALSEQRARAVKAWLMTEEMITDEKLLTEGFGATRPVAPNVNFDGTDDPLGRQKNRRVEIRIKK